MSEIKDFSANTVHVGIDVHLEQWNSSVYFENRHFKTFQHKPSGAELYKFLHRNFPNAKYVSAYEAGFSGFSAQRELTKLGIETIVINASDIPATDKDKKRKNDNKDAKRIGKSLVNNQLNGIYVPSLEAEADRRVVRYRTKLVRKDLLKAQQRIKSFLNVHGIKYFEVFPKATWSVKFVRWVEELEFENPSDSWMRDSLVRRLKCLQEERRLVDRQIVLLSRKERYSKLVQLLRSIPGIGLLIAMVLITEIIDIRRFSTLDKLCAFVGIVPDVSASDQTEKVKGMTKRANVELRRLLIQASWVAAGKDPVLARSYHKYKKQMQYQKAIIKVARKLLSGIKAVWIKEEMWKN